jgi:hypothetical protein
VHANEFAFATFQEGEPAVPDKRIEQDFEEESSRLAQSLKSCRSVVNDYRVILTGDHALPLPEETKEPDAEQ